MKKVFGLFLTAAFILLFLAPLPAQASGATLSASASSSTASVGGSVTVSINVSSANAINSASGSIVYSSSVLSATSVSTSGSIFTFWTTQPATGTSINFGGGLSTPGFAGTGKIFSITFKVVGAGTGTVSVVGGQVLANDGSGTNIYSATSGASIIATQAQQPLSISSTTHPSQSAWYKVKDAQFSWNKPTDVTGFTYVMSGSAGAASRTGSTTSTTVSLTGLDDGIWTFSLTGQSSKQDRTATYKIQIDNVAPAAFTVKVTQNGSTDPYPVVSYTVADSLSGIDHYTVTVDGQNTKQTIEASQKLDRLVPGHHQVTVVAFDKAGNTATANADIQLEGFPGPTITGYPGFVSVLEPVTLKGQALYGTVVKLFVDDKAGPTFTIKENLSNRQRQIGGTTSYKDTDQVEWEYFYVGVLTPGRHVFSAIQIKADSSESNMSNVVSVRVLWSSISLYGWTLPLAIIVVGLLALVAILIVLLIWIGKRSKRAVSGWRDRLVKVRKKVDADLSNIERDVVQTSAGQTGSKSTDAIKQKINQEVIEIDKVLDAAIETAKEEEQKDLV